jgi:hypothetical protein
MKPILSLRRAAGALVWAAGLAAFTPPELPEEPQPAASNFQARDLQSVTSGPTFTVCTYQWSGFATGWRYRPWQPWDCTNGLPGSNWASVGQAQNGRGTGGMPYCSPTRGGHYNHPSIDGATNGIIRCAFVAPEDPDVTVCYHQFTDYATGWRWRYWQPWDCTNGLPVPDSFSVGSSATGLGNPGATGCSYYAGWGGHYQPPYGATNANLTCMYVRPQNPRLTVCRYAFAGNGSGWRSHSWLPSDCSNGLPPIGSYGVGNGINGNGMGQMADCNYGNALTGGHYNNPYIAGVTTSVLTGCVYAR